ncbi:MAG: MafI family immunity protein [Bacteroidetes bacterium]|nr:MafI family immunity protein [Bacteroidota bacterium]
MPDFKVIEHEINGLLDFMEMQFTARERAEVQRFLHFGEYGLALETFIGIVTEEEKQITEAVWLKCNELAQQMEILPGICAEMKKFIR